LTTCVVIQSLNIHTKFGEIWSKNEGTSTSFVKFKMAAAAMLDSGNRALFGSMDEFVFKLATFQLNLMKFGQKMKEQHQFC